MKQENLVIFESEDRNVELRVPIEDETVWLTQAQMIELFGRDQSVISRHIRNIFKENELIAAIEICPETWSNRLMITELWVKNLYRKQGIGTALLNFVKKQALKKNYRAIILETQSCNTTAIEFYLKQEFVLFGFDRCCYHNDDMNRKEVRLNFGWFNSHFK